MFARAMRRFRKSFVWLTVLFGLVMAVCALIGNAFEWAAVRLEMPELGKGLPEAGTLLAWAGWAYFAVFGVYSALIGANILGRDLRRGTVSTMAQLPVSRTEIVFVHYFAGALCIVLNTFIVGAIAFGALYAVDAQRAFEAANAIFTPVFGFMAVYTAAFCVSSVVKSGSAALIFGIAVLAAAAADGLRSFLTAKKTAWVEFDSISGGIISGAAERTDTIVNGLFLPYAAADTYFWAPVAMAGFLAIAFAILISLAMYGRRNL